MKTGLAALILAAGLAAAPAWAQATITPGAKGPGLSLPVGGDNWSPNWGTVATTATLIVPARPGPIGTGRISITLNNQGSTTMFCGASSGINAGAGGGDFPVQAGQAPTINTTSAIWCMAPSGAETLGWWETY